MLQSRRKGPPWPTDKSTNESPPAKSHRRYSKKSSPFHPANYLGSFRKNQPRCAIQVRFAKTRSILANFAPNLTATQIHNAVSGNWLRFAQSSRIQIQLRSAKAALQAPATKAPPMHSPSNHPYALHPKALRSIWLRFLRHALRPIQLRFAESKSTSRPHLAAAVEPVRRPKMVDRRPKHSCPRE